MNRCASIISLTAAGLACCPFALRGQSVGSGVATRDILIQLDSARTQYDLAKSRYEAGQVTAAQLEEQKTNVARLELALQAAQAVESRQHLIRRLSSPVVVDLKDATLEQAVQSIAKASEVEVRVAKGVRNDAKLSLRSTGVGLNRLLDLVARRLLLQIAPLPGGGVELRSVPTLEVNGEKIRVLESSPWSPEWGQEFLAANQQLVPIGVSGSIVSNDGANYFTTVSPDYVRTGTGQASLRNLSQGIANQLANQNNSLYNPSNSQQSGMPQNSISGSRLTGAGLLQGVNLTSVGNLVVVAEPGRGPQGEPGAWLTVYSLEGVNLVRRSVLFHPTKATLVSPVGAGYNGQNSGSPYGGGAPRGGQSEREGSPRKDRK